MRRARAALDDDMSMEDAVAMNSGVSVFAKKWAINSVWQNETFKNLLPYSDARVEEIKESILERGFDEYQPIHLWMEGKNEEGNGPVVIDGNTRLEAARRSGTVFELPCVEHHFDSEDDAIKYALLLQIDRRNMEPSDLIMLIERYINLGGKRSLKEIKKELVEKTGLSLATVKRGIAVAQNDEAREKVLQGEATITGAYNDFIAKKSEPAAEEKTEEISEENTEEVSSEDSFTSAGTVQETYDEPKDEFEIEDDDENDVSSSAPQIQETPKEIKPKKVSDEPSDGSYTFVESDIKKREFARGFGVALRYVLARVILGDSAEKIASYFGKDDLTPDALNGFALGSEEKEALGGLLSQ